MNSVLIDQTKKLSSQILAKPKSSADDEANPHSIGGAMRHMAAVPMRGGFAPRMQLGVFGAQQAHPGQNF